MKQKFIFTLFILVLLMSTLSAVEVTEIKIKTVPHNEIQLILFDANSPGFSQLERFVDISDRYGDAAFNTTIDKSFNIAVYIKGLEHENIASETFLNSYSPGGEISLEVAPSDFTLIATPDKTNVEEVDLVEEVNETLELTDTVEETDENSKSSFLTNFAIFGEEGIISWRIVYIVVGIILLLIIALVIIKLIKKRARKGKDIVVKKWSEKQKEDENKPSPEKHEELKGLNEKLKELQNEIIGLKKQKSPEEHHKELEKRIEEKKKQVEKEEEDLIKLREEMKKE